ncbi:MAG TPA: hypothetical protein VL527_03435 [Dongiaceae bacterium]|nr:hypothetical protein [Dongiaceae bacterium]
MQTCKHFRNQVPREVADELRDADPEPCPVCDALPHRKVQKAGEISQRFEMRVSTRHAGCRTTSKRNWLTQLFDGFHPHRTSHRS